MYDLNVLCAGFSITVEKCAHHLYNRISIVSASCFMWISNIMFNQKRVCMFGFAALPTLLRHGWWEFFYHFVVCDHFEFALIRLRFSQSPVQLRTHDCIVQNGHWTNPSNFLAYLVVLQRLVKIHYTTSCGSMYEPCKYKWKFTRRRNATYYYIRHQSRSESFEYKF